MKDFRKLKVWEKAHALALAIYASPISFPAEERYGLTNQIRRAAVSIPTNIAEGCSQGTDPDLARFLQIRMGSASEVEYLLLISRDLGFLPGEPNKRTNSELIEIKKMLAVLIRTLRADSRKLEANV
jgi:four helix bundle protein